MKIALITPTRGDRPTLLDFCKEQVARMDPAPHEHIIIATAPKSSAYDIVARVKEGIEEAKRRACDVVIVVEDDDYYPAHFLRPYKKLRSNFTLAGDPRTIYYHIGTRRYTIHEQERASLFTTAINLDQFEDIGFTWPEKNSIYLDFYMWRYAKVVGKTVLFDTGAVGIKHSTGLCAGNGHRNKLLVADPDMAFLKSRVDSRAFEFYEKIGLRLRKRK